MSSSGRIPGRPDGSPRSTPPLSSHSRNEDDRLREILNYIYDASNLSQLRSEKRRKLDYIKRQQYDMEKALDDPQGQSIAQSMRNFVRENTEEIKELDDKLIAIERSAIKAMKEYFQSLVPSPADSLQYLEQYYQQKFQKQVVELDEKRKKETEAMMQHIDTVKRRMLTEDDARKIIWETLRKTKEDMLNDHANRIKHFSDKFDADIKGLKLKVDDLHSDKYVSELTSKAAQIVVTEIKKHISLDNLSEEEQKLAESEDGRPTSFIGQLVQALRKQVKKYIKEETQQQQLLQIPKYQELADRLTKVETTLKDAATQHSLELHHQTVRTIMQQLKEQQLKLEQTQKNMKESEARLHRNSSLATLTDMVKRVDNMNREISLLKNRVDMSSISLDVKYKEIERTIKEMQSNTDSGIGRKRQRVNTESNENEISSDTVNSIKEIEKRIQKLETKHQHLVEFVHQFRKTVLNPEFPGKLEEVVKQIEETLQNHDSFLAFLVDPVTALKDQEITVPLKPRKEESEEGLSPAMIQAIQRLVQKTAEETARPLLDRIAALEKAQSSRST